MPLMVIQIPVFLEYLMLFKKIKTKLFPSEKIHSHNESTIKLNAFRSYTYILLLPIVLQ